MRVAEPPFPAFDNALLHIEPEPGKLNELHLYHGSRCNRACAFCCVNGSPDGYHTPFTEPVLRAAVDIVARRGSVKIYGGEPTLDAENLRWTAARLRELGFEGAITLFSNGLRPRVLIDLLESDPQVRVVLNYAIATGSGEKPLPASTLARLRAYHCAHPGRLFVSHDFVVPVGRRKAEGEKTESRVESRESRVDPERPIPNAQRLTPNAQRPTSDAPTTYQGCYHCYPTLTGAGRFQACPFAVEYNHAHFALGDIETPSGVIQARFARFLRWIDAVVEPEARRQGRHACEVCTGGFIVDGGWSRTIHHSSPIGDEER
jgi:hypothetical protein